MENNKWIDQHDQDPRMPTDPEYIEIRALAREYKMSADAILQLALTRPGSCLQNDGNPWVEHSEKDQTIYFHEPTLQAALATNSG